VVSIQAYHQEATTHEEWPAMKIVFAVSDVRKFEESRRWLKFGPTHDADTFEFVKTLKQKSRRKFDFLLEPV
jgi:hypothetical protein